MPGIKAVTEVARAFNIGPAAGRWSPRRAREDAEEHERMVQQELAALDS